jgi:hypothetical protein
MRALVNSRNEPYAKMLLTRRPTPVCVVLDAGFWHWLDSILALSAPPHLVFRGSSVAVKMSATPVSRLKKHRP